jgi:hypothetical protein
MTLIQSYDSRRTSLYSLRTSKIEYGMLTEYHVKFTVFM